MLVCVCVCIYMLSWHHQDCTCVSNDFRPFFFCIVDYNVYSASTLTPFHLRNFSWNTNWNYKWDIYIYVCVCVYITCICWQDLEHHSPKVASKYVYMYMYIYIHIFICSIYLSMYMTRPRIPQHNGCLEGWRERLGPQGWRWRLCRWVE